MALSFPPLESAPGLNTLGTLYNGIGTCHHTVSFKEEERSMACSASVPHLITQPDAKHRSIPATQLI